MISKLHEMKTAVLSWRFCFHTIVDSVVPKSEMRILSPLETTELAGGCAGGAMFEIGGCLKCRSKMMRVRSFRLGGFIFNKVMYLGLTPPITLVRHRFWWLISKLLN